MNRPRSSTVSASSTPASSRSLSRKRISPLGRDVPGWGSATSKPAALPNPPTIDFFMRSSSVDLLELLARPLDRVLGLSALDALGEHVHQHVLRIGLDNLNVGRSRKAHGPRV